MFLALNLFFKDFIYDLSTFLEFIFNFNLEKQLTGKFTTTYAKKQS